MLSRIGSRSFRSAHTSIRHGPSPVLLRTYAKSHKPREPNNFKPSTHTSRIAASPKHGPAAPRSSPAPSSSAARDKADPSLGSSRLDELKARQKGTASSATDSESTSALDPQREPQTQYSNLQEEFDTPSDPEKNTAPRDGSPSSAEASGSTKAQSEETQSRIPLHDMTQGIPSTLDAELAQASKKRDKTDQFFEEDAQMDRQSTGGQGDRPMPASAYITSAERRRNRLMNWLFIGMGLMILTGPVYLGRNWESEEEERAHPDAPSGWGLILFYNRAKARLTTTLDYYNEPAFPKLLPDPDPAWERPYTLVMSLENLLIHSEWTRDQGWRMAKRPGVDYFLRYLSQYYELVIFTSVPSAIGGPVLMKLDPFGMAPWRLFREATRYKNGEYIKDLSFLNRDLSKIILLDTEQTHASAQPGNAIILPKWKGEATDKDLVGLIPFLEYVAAMGLDDTRKVLESFQGKHIPTEFSAREAQARERFQAQLDEERRKRPRRSGIGMLLGSMGMRSANAGGEGASAKEMALDAPIDLAAGFEQGKMLHDQIRERGQKQYEQMEKEIRENEGKWLKEIEADQERQKEEAMNSMKAGLTGWFGGEKKDK